jgi:hypothetical protein
MHKVKPVHVLQRLGGLSDDNGSLRFLKESGFNGFLEVPVLNKFHNDVQFLVIIIPTEAADKVALVLYILLS